MAMLRADILLTKPRSKIEHKCIMFNTQIETIIENGFTFIIRCNEALCFNCVWVN